MRMWRLIYWDHDDGLMTYWSHTKTGAESARKALDPARQDRKPKVEEMEIPTDPRRLAGWLNFHCNH